jgi:hypothetical protein
MAFARRMNAWKLCLVGVVGAAASVAQAQTSTLYNGGFEVGCLFCGGPFPEGWSSPGGNQLARRRSVDDGIVPAVTPRTGTSCVSIGTNGSGFYGLSTDSRNFCYCDQTCAVACPGPYPFFDPAFDYAGGDVEVSGYYMIPANDPIVNDTAGIKLNIKTLNQDVATLDFDYNGPNAIRGHTNGLWVPYTVRFTRDAIQAEYECNTGERVACGCECVPLAPRPNRVKIVLGRFAPDPGASGTIYWDDITVSQLPAGPVCDTIDFNRDTLFPDSLDLDDYIAVLGGGPNACSNFPNCGDLDFNNDGLFPDSTDLDAYISRLGGGPCILP